MRHHGDFLPRSVLPVAFRAGGTAGTRCEPSSSSWPVVGGEHWSMATGTGCSSLRRKPAAPITWPSWPRSSNFTKATSDIIYVYTAILDENRIYYVVGHGTTCITSRATEEAPDPIMAPHDTLDPTLRRALERHEIAVDEEPVEKRRCAAT